MREMSFSMKKLLRISPLYLHLLFFLTTLFFFHSLQLLRRAHKALPRLTQTLQLQEFLQPQVSLFLPQTVYRPPLQWEFLQWEKHRQEEFLFIHPGQTILFHPPKPLVSLILLPTPALSLHTLRRIRVSRLALYRLHCPMIFILFSGLERWMISTGILFPFTPHLLLLLPSNHPVLEFHLYHLNLKRITRQSILNIIKSGKQR